DDATHVGLRQEGGEGRLLQHDRRGDGCQCCGTAPCAAPRTEWGVAPCGRGRYMGGNRAVELDPGSRPESSRRMSGLEVVRSTADESRKTSNVTGPTCTLSPPLSTRTSSSSAPLTRVPLRLLRSRRLAPVASTLSRQCCRLTHSLLKRTWHSGPRPKKYSPGP